MTLMNPINGMLVNTTLINAGTLQLGAVNADVIVDLLTQGNVITTTDVTVNAVAEFLASSTVRLQSHEVPMWADAYMINRDIDKITPIDMVIIPDMHIEKYLPNINSFLAIGNVRMVSRVPRSFSPAVLSVEA